MSTQICRYCGCSELKRKEVEIRRINAFTMKIASRQQVVELECSRCGWIIPAEAPSANPTDSLLALAR